MKKKTYNQLVQCFFAGVDKTRYVDYSNRISVRMNNQGVLQYRNAAKNISEYFPEKIEDFSNLLFNEDAKIRICCAVCLVELMSCSKKQRELAINTVKNYIQTTSAPSEKRGFSIWMENHK